jgi:predicted dehydrogenase
MTTRVGFYGAGFISRLHAYLLAECGEPHEIVAVHDPDAARAASFADAHGARAVSEDELLELVDAVFVTTWTSEHPRLVERAAQRGVAIFCEKPLATDVAAVEGMLATVDAAGVANQVGLVLRASPAFLHVRRLLEDPRAGRVLAIVFRDDQFIPIQGYYGSTWRIDPDRAGRGTLMEHSIHDVDILRYLFGPVTAVSAVAREVHGYPKIDDVTVARLEFESGAIATLTSVWHDILERPSLRHVEVFCERLYVAVDGDFAGPVRWQYTGDEARSAAGEELVASCRELPDMTDVPATRFLEGFVFNTAGAFLRAVAEGRAARPAFAEALVAHRLVDALYRSADAGGVVVPDPEGPSPR